MTHNISLFRFRPDRGAAVAAAAFIACVALNVLARAATGTPLRPVFYHGLLMLGLGFVFPTWYARRCEGGDLRELGLRRWPLALLIGAALALALPRPAPLTGALFYTAVALLMSGAFEEIFFRGFLQPRLERAFGVLPAILLSGAAFSIYHVGYARFDTPPVLAQMFALGLLFAIVYRVTGTVLASLAVSEVLAVPHFTRQGHFTAAQVPLCVLVLVLGGLWLHHIQRRAPRGPRRSMR